MTKSKCNAKTRNYCCACVTRRPKKQGAPPASTVKPLGFGGSFKPSKAKQATENVNNQNDDWSTEDIGNVAIQIRDIEDRFERRKKYQSMFKDAPLYQVYDERHPSSLPTPRTPIATVSPGPFGRNVNSLEFTGSNFTPIDSEEAESSALISEVNGRSSAASSLSTSRQKSSPTRTHSPVTFDNRLRTARKPSHTTDQHVTNLPKKVVKRTPSDPTEMQAFVAEFAGTGPNRAMWSSMPQVVALGLPKGLSTVQRKLQEALFEIITSEASYYRSLNVLIEVFYKSPYMQPGDPSAVLTLTQKHHLFSNILDIHLTSENLLRAMEACFREDPWLIRLGEIVYEHAEQKFDTYQTYMQNQMFQYRTLENLKKNPAFIVAMGNLQKQPECAFLNLSSFLILPTQRIPRMCLLMTTMLKYAVKGSLVYRSGLVALASLDKCAREGEAKKLYLEQKERLMNLAKQFEYKFDARSLATESRRLIKEGELGLLTAQHVQGSAFRQRLSGIIRSKSIRASLFLFNDLLVIAKRRKNNRLSVDEYSPLSDVKVEVLETQPGEVILRHYPNDSGVNGAGDQPSKPKAALARRYSSPANGERDAATYPLFPFKVIIQSETHPRAEYTLQAKSLSERERWVDAIAPNKYSVPDDLLIRDCPQVLIVRSYLPIEGDELELQEGDSATLLVSLSDGWCKGMLPGGRKGWFPDHVCVEVEDDTVKHENVQKFLLMEEARNAYRRRKAREHFIDFKVVQRVSR